jgi:hypothetical protein
MNEWENIPENIEDYLGFVYLIEIVNVPDDYPVGKPTKYIGKKMTICNRKLKPLKGKTRNRRVIKSSDWKTYFGSSNDLKEILKKYGPDIFKRTILHCCESKWTLAYMETLEQMRHGVLFDDSFFNGIIHFRIGNCPKDLREKYKKISDDIFNTSD